MKAYLREYLLWRAGYRAGEKPDRSRLFFKPVDLPAARASCLDILKRAGYAPGQRPDQAEISEALSRGDLQRHYGYVPPFPLPIHPKGWRAVVKRSAWGFFSSHCRGLTYVGNSDTL